MEPGDMSVFESRVVNRRPFLYNNLVSGVGLVSVDKILALGQ